MTDGAGRLSRTLAQKIARQLGLDYMPSGFQGRFGDAKGFWTIDPQATDEDDWIEVYDSQRKWKRAADAHNDPDFDDPSHRTFEVNNQSNELKSADLNTQLLPILVDRAIDKPMMVEAIVKLLEQGLAEEIEAQRVAMENPQTCRVWVRGTNPRMGERIK